MDWRQIVIVRIAFFFYLFFYFKNVIFFFLFKATSSSPNLVTPKADIENEFEPSKQCGRKRKQQAPRKVVSSANTPEDGEVDVCGVGESPEEKSIYKDMESEIKPNKVLQLNGESNYKNISSQKNLDDMLYLYR